MLLSTALRLPESLAQWFTGPTQTIDGRKRDLKDPHISPYYSEHLSGQPPAYLLTCGHNPLRDMGLAYAQKLVQAGVHVTHKEYSGQIHGFLQFARVIPQAETALNGIVDWLKKTIRNNDHEQI